MKRILSVMFALVLAATFVAGGCSKATQPTGPTMSTVPQPTYTYAPTTPPRTGYATTVAGSTYTRPATSVPGTTIITQPPATTIIVGPYPATTTTVGGGTIGLSTGGAKDIVNFRQNIQNDYLPLPADVTYEGLFYDYFFDTGATESTDKLFAPSYSYAVTRDPISLNAEYYLSVGLNSGLKESDFQRKRLNIVLVVDTSGSMGENFNQYYYDNTGKRIDVYAEEGGYGLKKIDSARKSVLALLDQLREGDRLAVVQFNSNAFLTKAMGPVREADRLALESKVQQLTAGGSTNLMAGMDLATSQFHDLRGLDGNTYENRILVLTDAQPNTGDYSSSGLMGAVANNANARIYTTFIGIGVDFNTQLIEEITKTKGSNYYAVHSPSEFRQRMEDEFDYMVTPLVFNVRLNFVSSGWKIDKVFGSPGANQATGELIRIDTLFPSKNEGGETRGGLVLLKLRKTSGSPDEPVTLSVTYEDRNGRKDGSKAMISLERTPPEYFDNSGIRKGVLLTRYAALLKRWMTDEREHASYSRPWNPSISESTGIGIPPENVGQWERTSLPLLVSPAYKKIFSDFRQYFKSEMGAIGDGSLGQELGVLTALIGS